MKEIKGYFIEVLGVSKEFFGGENRVKLHIETDFTDQTKGSVIHNFDLSMKEAKYLSKQLRDVLKLMVDREKKERNLP